MNFLVSVVIPVYNAAEFLKETVLSVLQQDWSDIEIIIVNDGSTDNSAEIINCFANKYSNIKAVHRENKGVCHTRNEGIALARGEYIALLDADDVCLPTRISTQVNFLQSNPSVALVGSSVISINKDGLTLGRSKKKQTDYFIKSAMLTGSQMANPTVMFNRMILGENLTFIPGYETVEDLELWLRLAKLGFKFANIKTPLLKYRTTASSLSNTNHQMKLMRTGELLKKYFAPESSLEREFTLLASHRYSYKYFLAYLRVMARIKIDRYYISRSLGVILVVSKCLKRFIVSGKN